MRRSSISSNTSNILDKAGASAQAEELVLEGDIQILTTINAPTDVLCVKYTPGFEYLAVGLSDGKINLYNLPSAALTRTLFHNIPDTETRPVTCIKHKLFRKSSRKGRNTINATYVDGSIRCWDFFTGALKYHIKEDRQVLGLAFHTELAKFVTVGDTPQVHLYDEETNKLEGIYESTDIPESVDGHVSRVFAACFNPRYPYEFITGGWDDTIQIWDMRQSRAIRHASGAHVCGDGLDINKTGRQIASFSWQKENAHQLWDYGTGKLILNIDADNHQSMLYCGKFLPKDNMVMGGTDPSLIRVIDKNSMAVTCRIRGLAVGVYSLDSGMLSKRKNPLKTASDGWAPMPRISFCSGKKVYEIDFT